MEFALTMVKHREMEIGMNSIIIELATLNFITICLIVFGAFALIRMVRTNLEG